MPISYCLNIHIVDFNLSDVPVTLWKNILGSWYTIILFEDIDVQSDDYLVDTFEYVNVEFAPDAFLMEVVPVEYTNEFFDRCSRFPCTNGTVMNNLVILYQLNTYSNSHFGGSSVDERLLCRLIGSKFFSKL